ncbi:Rne/Rng family ribonuclease [Dissulfurimicrobium hydrothermale]|uniref:Rne/Rng family ribonuclease n=1 Tax=Dissulfurimicrobium hydrothermale TaxID=1750598 RepID=UPI001EDA455D|nr:Rne/Rng family ribonuclease [Dissulfurimicrobium hydrothermale]UKL13747.1 Rne/Rng family ribonuclease [Dissulfurimicrobium hydrothermale]
MEKRKNDSKKAQLRIVINADAPEERRVALLENGRLEAFQLETVTNIQTRGNIYKARLVNVEPALEAAFVDIGLSRNGYLPFDEIHPEYYGYSDNKERLPEILKKGQEFLVQIVKEETPVKGPAVTTYLSIPGRYLVLMPGSDQSGVSRKIEDEAERKRVKEILSELKRPEGIGLIARTVSAGATKLDIRRDFGYLLRLWQSLRKKAGAAQAPSLLYTDRDIVTRFLRDYLSSDVRDIVVDNQQVFSTVKSFLKIVSPRHVANLFLYKEDIPIFTSFGIEPQIEEIYKRRVELPSGGHIVIEPTEALVSIDVNSGKNVKEKDIEDTALKTNIEAAEEIARQLRLRDLGGIIVIDFIDMRTRSYRQQIERRLKECLKRDRARTEISKISSFGLMELVRQKISSPVQMVTFHPCPYCKGRGVERSVETLALSHMRTIRSYLVAHRGEDIKELVFEAPSKVLFYMFNNKKGELCELEKKFNVAITAEENKSLDMEEIALYARLERSP